MVRQKKLIEKENITEDQAIKFLESHGYTIIKEDVNSLEKSVGLVEKFYNNLNKLYIRLGYPEVTVIEDKKDINQISKYIKNCHTLGISKKKALDNLNSIIEFYFQYYDELGLTQPSSNLRFLLLDGSWILNKIRIIHKNKIEKYKDSQEMEQWRDRLYNQEDDIILKLRDQRHKELLNSLNTGESFNGKEEEK